MRLVAGHGSPALPAPLGHAAPASSGLGGGGGVQWMPPLLRLLVDVTSSQLPLKSGGAGGETGEPLPDLVCGIKVRGGGITTAVGSSLRLLLPVHPLRCADSDH